MLELIGHRFGHVEQHIRRTSLAAIRRTQTCRGPMTSTVAQNSKPDPAGHMASASTSIRRPSWRVGIWPCRAGSLSCSGPQALEMREVRCCAAGVIARRRSLLVLVAALVAALGAGCGNGSTVMDRSTGAGTVAGPEFGGSMMGSVPHGYHLARLTCSAPSSLPGSTIYVMVGDMDMTSPMGGVAPLGARMMLRAVPTSVPAGQVSFAVGNMGWRTHEMVVLPLAPGQAAGERAPGPDGRVDETGNLGEASASCAAGSGEGIKVGTVGWVTLTLPVGRYELVCNLRNHYANGMYQAFVVT
jgi:uncharacterized cupredoxin-like copper-binding protein